MHQKRAGLAPIVADSHESVRCITARFMMTSGVRRIAKGPTAPRGREREIGFEHALIAKPPFSYCDWWR
jgi:hypothetical protein